MNNLIILDKKLKFIKKYKKLFKESNWDKIIELARKELKYSKKTVSTDIKLGLEKVYRII